MLREIFEKIATEAHSYLLLKGLTPAIQLGSPDGSSSANGILYIGMEQYGIDPVLRNHPQYEESNFPSTNFSHLISFYIVPRAAQYEQQLQLIENMVLFFEEKPFFQLTVDQEEYELAISMKPTNSADYQQFWIALQQPSQPVLFYQARVSSL